MVKGDCTNNKAGGAAKAQARGPSGKQAAERASSQVKVGSLSSGGERKRVAGRISAEYGAEDCGGIMLNVLAQWAYDASRSGTPQQLDAIVEHCKEKKPFWLDTASALAFSEVTASQLLDFYSRACFYFALAGLTADESGLIESIGGAAVALALTLKDNGAVSQEEVDAALAYVGAAGTRAMPLHAPDGRALHQLWLHSSKQKKLRTKKSSANEPGTRLAHDEVFIDSKEGFGFKDPSLPLVLDVGCGFGTTIIGLAQRWLSEPENAGDLWGQAGKLDSKCNFLGCDLSKHAIGYAKGVTKRLSTKTSDEEKAKYRRMRSRVSFLCMSGEDLLRAVLAWYPGPIFLILIQFPTPYKLMSTLDKGTEDEAKSVKSSVKSASQDVRVDKRLGGAGDGGSGDGNTQLPSIDKGFMVSQELADLVGMATSKAGTGRVFVQSNVEDVAMAMSDRIEAASKRLVPLAKDSHGRALPTEAEAKNSAGEPLPPTLRQERWLALGGERPSGPGWLFSSAFPFARTETEASYENIGKPLYRKMWVHGVKDKE